MIKLSILVPSLLNRDRFRDRLISLLKPQVERPDVEVIFTIDEGEVSIGAKRNKLIEDASGKYVVFIDDDDRISADYVDQMMEGIDKDVDAVCIRQIITFDGRNPKLVIDSPYQEATFRDNIYYRGAQHLDAIKKEIAIQIKYPDKSFGEDAEYTKVLADSKLIKTWHNIMKPVYFYEYRSKK